AGDRTGDGALAAAGRRRRRCSLGGGCAARRVGRALRSAAGRVHELSVALEICRIAESRLPAGDHARLTEVGLVIGHDAGIEVANLEFCLEALLGAPPFGSARPVITRVPGDDLRVDYLEVDDGSPDDRSS